MIKRLFAVATLSLLPAIAHAAVHVHKWKPPVRLNETTRAYFEGRMTAEETFHVDYRHFVGRPVEEMRAVLRASDKWTPGIPWSIKLGVIALPAVVFVVDAQVGATASDERVWTLRLHREAGAPEEGATRARVEVDLLQARRLVRHEDVSVERACEERVVDAEPADPGQRRGLDHGGQNRALCQWPVHHPRWREF